MEEVEEVEEVPQNGEQADSEAEDDGEEFEIEAIIEAKHGVFGGVSLSAARFERQRSD